MTLAGKLVIVTRPQAQAVSLLSLLREEGANTRAFPLLEIVPMIPKPLPKHLSADILIFVSANAVEHGKRFLSENQNAKLIAVGSATAAALQYQLPLADIITPEDSSSEGVLELPELQQVGEKQIVIVSGKGGRGLLQKTLKQRGAFLFVLEVYRRKRPLGNAGEIISQNPYCIVITSGEALRNLCHMVPGELWAQLMDTQLLVVSERIAEIARSLGFRRSCWVSDGAGGEAIIARLREQA